MGNTLLNQENIRRELLELKIKELNKSVIQQSKPKTNKEKLDDMFINSKQYNVWNKRKEELIKEGINIKDTPDFYFGFDTESGKLYKDLLLKKNNQTVLGFINKDKDSMFVVAHGTKKGKIHVGKNNQMTIEQLGEYLQENNLIPDGIKNIYTVDCYGGLQKPVQLKNGIIIQSSHTSDKPVFSKLANEKLTFLGLQGDAEIIPEVQKFQGQKLSLAFDTDTFHNARLKLNTDSNGQYYFGDIQSEESIKVNEEVSIKNTDNNIKGQISFIDDNGNIKEEYIIKKKLTKEASEEIPKKKLSKLTLEDAIKKSSYYDVEDYLSQKDIIDKNFLSIANTEEAQQTLLKYITNPETEISIDDIARKNASAHKTDKVSHGLFAYGDNAWAVNDNTNMSQSNIIKRNLDTVISNKDIELSMTEDAYKLGPIGITGTADITGYFPQDTSSISKNGIRTSRQNGKNVINNILDIEDGGLPQSYSEYYGKNFNIESLWVRDDYFNAHKDEVISLLKEYNIEKVDLIHGNNNFSPEYTKKSLNFDRISTKDLIKESSVNKPKELSGFGFFEQKEVVSQIASEFNEQHIKHLTPQEAFNKYGPNDDRFYTSQGLNPSEQRNKINELNSKRKPIEDNIFIKPEEYDKVEKEFKDIANEIENLKNNTEEIVKETTESIQKELPKKQLTEASTEAIESNIKNIDFKKVGKIGAVVSAIGLGAYAIGKHNKNKKEEKQQQIQYPQNNYYIGNSYAQQMASDISSYRYGKQMTGFIN